MEPGARKTGVRRGCRRCVALVWVVITVAAIGVAAWSTALAAPEAAGAGIERRIAELEALVAQLRAQIESLRGGGAGAAPMHGTQATFEELEKRIDALALEIERLRIGEAASPPPPTQESHSGFGPAASKIYGAKHGVSIGGYGEMLYQNFHAHADDGSPSGRIDTADLERAVLYFGYKWTDHLLFNSEIEFAHAVTAPDAPGEVEVEFAYLDDRVRRGFGVRGGLLLVPMGFLNELHEPPIFHGARRPEVEQFILPSTWRENGFGIYGDAGPLTYRAYLVTSLDAVGFSPDLGVREGRQEGAEALAHDLALTARLDALPVAGVLFGASVFTGGTGQGSPAIGRARMTLWDAHAEWNLRGVHVRTVMARGVLGQAEAVSLAIDPSGATAIGSRTRGWYGEAAWNVLSLFRKDDRDLSPFVRYEALDTQAEVVPGFARDPVNDRSVWTYGVTCRPIPNVAIKLDFQDFRNRAGTGVDQINFALGYLF
jgi:hypothetical protein